MNPTNRANLEICYGCENRVGSRVLTAARCKLDGITVQGHAGGRPCQLALLHKGDVTITVREKPTQEPWPARGAKLWARLHTAAYGGALSDAIVAEVLQQLPCGECKQHAVRWIETSPLPADPAEHPEWVDRWHNAVSALRGVREWSKQEADERWKPSPAAWIESAPTPV